MSLEYRVRWRREGRQRTTKIFQTWDAACRKVRGILALEDVKAETNMATMPDLAEKPVVEAREVGVWVEHPVQPGDPTERDREGMREYFPPPEGYGNYGDSGEPYADGVPF
jgi:hypothetical protein